MEPRYTEKHFNDSDQSKPQGNVVALRVFRVEPGQNVFIRVLSESYCGLLTHFSKGRSVYCKGSECPATVHNVDPTWKGYAAVEIHRPGTQVWVPWVLEITEHLELDMRGIFARGQVWELWAEKQTDKRRPPVQGKLAERRDPLRFPAAFDIVPVIQCLYHNTRLDLQKKNPLPPRVIVSESTDDAPVILQGPRLKTPEEIAANKQADMDALEVLMGRKKTPTDRANGKH